MAHLYRAKAALWECLLETLARHLLETACFAIQETSTLETQIISFAKNAQSTNTLMAAHLYVNSAHLEDIQMEQENRYLNVFSVPLEAIKRLIMEDLLVHVFHVRETRFQFQVLYHVLLAL